MVYNKKKILRRIVFKKFLKLSLLVYDKYKSSSLNQVKLHLNLKPCPKDIFNDEKNLMGFCISIFHEALLHNRNKALSRLLKKKLLEACV